jgi:glycosyltransferase 2 family protein
MIKQVVKLALAAVLLVLILSRMDMVMFYEQIKAQDTKLLVLAFLSVPVWILLKTLKWKMLLQTFIEKPALLHVIRSFLAGLAIGMVTPGKVGELSRAFFIRSQNRSRVAGLVVVDRYSDLLMLIFFISFGVLNFMGPYWTLGVILTGVAGTGALFIMHGIAAKGFFSKTSNVAVDRIRDMLKALEGINFKLFLPLLVVTAAIMMLSIVTSYCLLLSFTSIPFMTALNVFPLVLMTNILPITFGNLGVREGTTIFLLSTYGISDEVSLSIALSLFVLHTLIPSFIGIILMQFDIEKESEQ